MIFMNGPYLMGPQVLYLNRPTLDFNLAIEIPKFIPVWVHFPNFPMHYWNIESLKSIGDSLGRFIDMAIPKDQYDCACICVEVDMESGIP